MPSLSAIDKASGANWRLFAGEHRSYTGLALEPSPLPYREIARADVPRVGFAVRLSHGTIARLKAAATFQGVTASEIARQAIEDALQQIEREQGAMAEAKARARARL